MPTPPALVVLSHLRWHFVYQRPQHLMSRFAKGRPVVFIEEPVRSEGGGSRWEFLEPEPGVTVCRPHTPLPDPGFSDAQNAALVPMVERLIAERVGADYDLWFYTPLALPLAAGLNPRVVIFDKMDDLASFNGASPALRRREAELLVRAGVVFTGGPSLHRATAGRHANCHCFSSSVDAAHFARAAGRLPEPPVQADLPGPRLGYFGVVDERFDAPLLAAAAEARPDWQWVVVGPVVKIDPATLPRRANIHYAGQQSYADLPNFLSGWDVALLPFARNDSTRMISPTKVLEYMAAGKPIVSTCIADVADPYGDMVGLGDDAVEFVRACEAALAETPAETAKRLIQFDDVLSRTSWDRTARQMAALIEEAAAESSESPAVVATGYPVVVIGAGPTGLSAAYHVGADALLVEAEDRVGGWCRSIEDNGFTFDYAGHIMFSKDPYVLELYEMLLGENVHWQDREAWVYSKSVHTRYPFQGALYGLPPDVITECIVGAVAAHNGTGAVPAATPTNGTDRRTAGSGPDPKDLTEFRSDGVAKSATPAVSGAKAAAGPRNFEEFIYQVWGAGIAKHFAVPYNRKIWAVPLDQMETSWLGGRVPMPDLEEMITGALTPKPKPMGPNARFGYPLRGGFQALMDGFLPHLKGPVKLGTAVTRVSPSRRALTLDDGSTVRYEQLISTMPLPELIARMGDEVPSDVRAAVGLLRYTSVKCVNIGVGREKLTEKHWIYYPEATVFHRVFVQGNASPHCNPPGGFGLTCEITYGPLKPLPCDGDELIARCVRECVEVGLMQESDPVWAANVVDMPYAYVVYDHARAGVVARIRDWLRPHGVILAGRYSEWEYYNSDHAFLAGKKAAEAARADGRRAGEVAADTAQAKNARPVLV